MHGEYRIMSSFAAWGLTILGLAVTTTIAEMLLPQGKTRKVIRSCIATVTVLLIVTPLPQMLKSGFDFDFFGGGGIETDGKYIEYVDDAKRKMIEQSVEEYLRQSGYDGVIVSVELGDGGFTAKSASIKFDETGITENDAHIHKSEIIKLVAEYLRLGEEAVMTYG